MKTCMFLCLHVNFNMHVSMDLRSAYLYPPPPPHYIIMVEVDQRY